MPRPVGTICPNPEAGSIEQTDSNSRGRVRGRGRGGRGRGKGRGKNRGRGGSITGQEVANVTTSHESNQPQSNQNRENPNHTGRPRGTRRGRGRGRGVDHAHRGSRGNQQRIASVGPYKSLVIEKRPESQTKVNASTKRGKNNYRAANSVARQSSRRSRKNSMKDGGESKGPLDKGKAPVRQFVTSSFEGVGSTEQKTQHHATAIPTKDSVAPGLLDQTPGPSTRVVEGVLGEIDLGMISETSSIQVEIDREVPVPLPPVPQQNTRTVEQPMLQKSPLFRLPGELRTKIYEYVFRTYRVKIYRCRAPTTIPSKRRCRLRHWYLPPYHPHIHDLVPRTKSRPSVPRALVYTCKDIYNETVLFMYSNTQFVFCSTKAIHMFLKQTPLVAQNAIRHLELNYIGYNEPRLTEFRKFKCRSDMAWYLACSAMAQNFISLRVLHLNVTIWDWPLKLDLKERWAMPLLLFERKGGLDYVDVNLHMHMFNRDQLQKVAHQLEKALMKPKAFQVKDDRRLAMKLQGPMRAGKVLNIVF